MSGHVRWLLLSSLLCCASGWAQPGQPVLLVMDFESTTATLLEAEAATQNVARGLRQLDVFQVLSSADVRQLLAIERDRQLLGLDGDKGLSDFSTSLGAQHRILGSVTRAAAGLSVELRLVDTASAKVLAQKSAGPAPKMDSLAGHLAALAQELVSVLLQAQRGMLLVASREEGAEVLVDEVLVASTPMKEPLKLSRGAHRLQVRKDGFIAASRTVRIQPEQLSREEVSLVPSSDYAEAYSQRHGRLRTGAYIATALGVAALGGAVYLDRAVSDPTFRQEFVPRQLALSGAALTPEVRDSPSLYETWRACGADEATCRTDAYDLQQQLKWQQLATAGMATVGVVAAGISSYLWLTGEDPNRYTRLVASLSFTPDAGGSALVLSGTF